MKNNFEMRDSLNSFEGLEEINPKDISMGLDKERKMMVVVIKPDAFDKKDIILSILKSRGLFVLKTVTKILPPEFILGSMYKDLPESIRKEIYKHFANKESEIILLQSDTNILDTVVSVLGKDTNPGLCDKDSIRYLFGERFYRETDDGKKYFRNAVHRAKNETERNQDLDKFEEYL